MECFWNGRFHSSIYFCFAGVFGHQFCYWPRSKVTPGHPASRVCLPSVWCGCWPPPRWILWGSKLQRLPSTWIPTVISWSTSKLKRLQQPVASTGPSVWFCIRSLSSINGTAFWPHCPPYVSARRTNSILSIPLPLNLRQQWIFSKAFHFNSLKWS